MTEVKLGEMVPDFTLPAAGGEEFTLSKQKGKKVVLFFYPKDSTPTCTKEACSFRDVYGEFKNNGAIVAGISPDSLKSHEKFRDKHELPFLLLSDPERRVIERFGVWVLKNMFGREYMGVERSTFLIDQEGRLVREWRKVKVDGHAEEVLEAVKALG